MTGQALSSSWLCCFLISCFILKLCPHVSCVQFPSLSVIFHPSSVFPFFSLTCPFPRLAPPAPHPLVSGCVYSRCALVYLTCVVS